MITSTRVALAAAAIAIAVAAGAIGYAIGSGDDGHMERGWRGDMPAMAHRGHDGEPGDWAGPHMQMGAMPGMRMHDGAMAMDERGFIAMMVPHHEMALEMAEAVIANGADAEVRALAGRVIEEQRDEIARMRAWHREWYGGEPPEMPMSGAMAMMGMAMDHTAIAAAPDPDREFLAQMLPHHAGAIMMADMTLAGEPREEIAELAREIVAAQAAEMGEMQEVRARIAPPLG